MSDWESAQEGAFYELLADQVKDGYFDNEESDDE